MLLKDMSIEHYKKVVDLGFNYLYLEDLMQMCYKMPNPNEFWEEMKSMLKKDLLNTDFQIQHIFILNKEHYAENKEFL